MDGRKGRFGSRTIGEILPETLRSWNFMLGTLNGEFLEAGQFPLMAQSRHSPRKAILMRFLIKSNDYDSTWPNPDIDKQACCRLNTTWSLMSV